METRPLERIGNNWQHFPFSSFYFCCTPQLVPTNGEATLFLVRWWVLVMIEEKSVLLYLQEVINVQKVWFWSKICFGVYTSLPCLRYLKCKLCIIIENVSTNSLHHQLSFWERLQTFVWGVFWVLLQHYIILIYGEFNAQWYNGLASQYLQTFGRINLVLYIHELISNIF